MISAKLTKDLNLMLQNKNLNLIKMILYLVMIRWDKAENNFRKNLRKISLLLGKYQIILA